MRIAYWESQYSVSHFPAKRGGVSSIRAGATLNQSLSEIANVSLLLIEEWCAATSRRTAHLPAFK